MYCVNSEYRRFGSQAELVREAVYFSLSQVNLVSFRGTILLGIVHTVRFLWAKGLRTHFFIYERLVYEH
ncbi:hypothetical protein SDC9_175965 [bioreactor metagenome]|uniref:Uncharacterized protein n=2 Tax=root TaxID=1 RepID=A0ABY0HWN5_CITAM|nr:hypothetical protein C2U53_09895 [Citrobacter sp. CFNIH10]AVC45134.1 hypothetical protein AL524_24355 [Citrobacter amalonaticus]PNP33943.1 hypothetical protein AL525_008795 [Citrobacter amalonaticus]RSC57570.1 hypothetical protein EGW07_07970 [Citrobacter amalonaticus]RYT44657.1 hypothetical protein EAJ18_10095 [Citrobacter amalonaticus]